ncbi:hypothetical protein N7516_000647 [Penicillium verrucosum]|uniref:uncharacterized protein n=1 Tax=Penicillium verrucosum TaxID=60171 RepID=UPI00254589FB|nr:uncharacterized protein N7516_000647 [Penicillium verrucosum]KAJ5940479.1 hypothetical protein N7516_000647 [Penicillium verrucosum]
MERSMYTDHERRVISERNKKYRGIALINLSQIVPHNSICRALDPRNVDRLCGVFSKEGCRRLDVPNHVTAVVSSHSLDDALQKARVSAAQLMSDTSDGYPHLQFPSGEVKCLHGQHRLKAGEEFLADCDQWWTVNLYLDDISPSLQATLVDEYCNEKTPTDGEIYRKIRQYQHEANAHFEKRWKSRLSPNKLKRFQQLESHDDVRAAVNSLLALPALLEHGMKICSISRALAIGCDEELVIGLNDLYEYWSSLVKHKRSKMLKIDPRTIQSLQLLAPGVSNKDRKLAKGLVLSGEAFSAFTSAERTSIWKLMKSRKRIIPSLYTFFRNVWYLESCANCLKRIVSLNKKQPTIKRAVRNAFSKPHSEGGDCLIQVSETKFRPYKGHETDRAELAYRQLWLYAMRHYLKMAKEPENQDDVVKAWEKADPRILYDLAVLARRLGFRSDRIKSLLKQSPDRQIAREALLKARDHEQYKYDNDVFDSLVDRVAECFQQASPLNCDPERGLTDGREIQIRHQCGYPQVKAQRQDRWFLFIDQLHTAWPSTTKKVSTLFVRQCVYYTFFNRLPFTSPSVTDRHPMSPLFVAEEGSERISQFSKEEVPSRKVYRKTREPEKRRKEKGYGRHREERRRHERREKKRTREHKKGRKQSHGHRRENHQSPRSRYPQLEWHASANSPKRIYSIRDHSNETHPSSTSGEEEGYRIDFGEHLQQSSELGTDDDTEMPHEPDIECAGDPTHESQADNSLMPGQIAREQMQDTQSQSLATIIAEQDIPGEHSWESTYQREEEMATNEVLEDAVVENTGELESAELATQQAVALPGHGPSRRDSKRSRWRDDAKYRPYDVAQRRKRERPSVSEQPQDALERQIGELLQPSEMSSPGHPTRPVTQIDFSEMPPEPPQVNEGQESDLADREYQKAYTEHQSPWDTTVTTSAGIFDPGRGKSQEFSDSMGNGATPSTHDDEPSTFQTTIENNVANQAEPVVDDGTNLSENLTSTLARSKYTTEDLSQPSIQFRLQSRRDGVVFAQPTSEQPSVDDVLERISPETQATSGRARAEEGHEKPTALTSTTVNDQPIETQQEQPSISQDAFASHHNSSDGERGRSNTPSALHAPTRHQSKTPKPLEISGPSDHMNVDGPSGRKRRILFGHRARKDVQRPRNEGISRRAQATPGGAQAEEGHDKYTAPISTTVNHQPIETQELSPGSSDDMNVDGSSGTQRRQSFGHRPQQKVHRPKKEIKQPRAVTQIDFTNWTEVATSERESGDPDKVDTMRQELLAHPRWHGKNQSTRLNDLDENDSQNIAASRPKQIEDETVDHEWRREEDQNVRIIFRGRDDQGGWDYVIHQITVNPSNPVAVEAFAREKAKENVPVTFYDQNLRAIPPAQCFDAAVQDGTNTIFVAYGPELVRNEENMNSVSRALAEGSDH